MSGGIRPVHPALRGLPHLSREWKTLAGRSPAASQEEFPNLHDVLPGAPAD